MNLGVFKGNICESRGEDNAVPLKTVEGNENSMRRVPEKEESRASSGGGGGRTVSLGEASERGSPAVNLGVFGDPTSRNITEITGIYVESIAVHILLHVCRTDACVFKGYDQV